MTPTKPMVEKWEFDVANYVHQGEYDDDLPIYGIEEANKAVKDLIASSVQEAKAEERERILEAIQPAVNDFMAAANTLVEHKMVKTAKEMRENTQYIVCAIRGTHKEYAASLKQEEGEE